MRVIHKFKPNKVIESKLSHTLIAGVSGSGKGMLGEFLVPQYALNNEKVFDMNSEDRGEGMYYSLPQTDPFLKSRIKYLTADKLKPRTFKSEIIMFLGNNLKKLKKLPENIKVCVFNDDWLDNEDLKNFLAYNDTQEALMDAVSELHGDQKLNLKYLYEFLAKASNKMTKESRLLRGSGVHMASVNVIKRRARVLLRSGLFHNKKEDLGDYFHYLDLETSLKQTDTITTFSRYLINSDFVSNVCVNVLLKKFIELLELRIHYIPIVFYIRELRDFYIQTHPKPYIESIREKVDMLLRKGRSLGGSKITVLADTQYLKDIPSSVFYGFAKHYIFKLPTKDSRILQYKANIPDLYLHKLADAGVGMCMNVTGGVFEYPYRTIPTLHSKADPKIDVFRYLVEKFGEKNYSKSSFLDLDLFPAEKPAFEVT